MTDIEPRGRISPGCAGIWNDDQARAWSKVTDFIKAQGAVPGMQIAHAGRKASRRRSYDGGGQLDETDRAKGEPGWETVAPSAIPFGETATPHALTVAELAEQLVMWREGTQRAVDAGFDVIEIHGAHGYLLHQFLSPLSNHRTDAYGGDLEGRMRFPLEVVETVRAVLPKGKPLFVRISATDWVDGGFTPDEAVVFSQQMKVRGVDVVDCSAGGNTPTAPAASLGYQTPYAERIRREAEIATCTVGAIVGPQQAEDILQAGQADLVAIGRAALGDPNWPVRAKEVLAPEASFDAWSKAGRHQLAMRDGAMKRLGLL